MVSFATSRLAPVGIGWIGPDRTGKRIPMDAAPMGDGGGTLGGGGFKGVSFTGSGGVGLMSGGFAVPPPVAAMVG